MFLVNWFKRLFGYHVCDEFTRWETQRVITYDAYTHAPVRVNCFQERTCTICGATYQRRLRHAYVLNLDEKLRERDGNGED